jgi:predicted glycosyltransferase
MHAITALVSDGHRVGVCVRRNHAASARLEAVEFEHTVLTTPPASPLGSTAERVLGAVRLGRYTRAFAPSVIVGESTPAVRAASRLTGARLVSWDEPTAVDGDIVSPALYGAAARYHPEWFSPDEAVRERHGVDEPGEYTIALFTAKASPYNAPEGGLSRRTKGKLVETLSTVGRVYVDNVDDPHPALAASRITVPPRETPHLARGASLVVTDSAQVAVGSALCEAPTVYTHVSESDPVPEQVAELATRDLVRVAVGDSEAQSTVEELAATSDRETRWKQRVARFFEAIGNPTADLLRAVLGSSDRSRQIEATTRADEIGSL